MLVAEPVAGSVSMSYAIAGVRIFRVCKIENDGAPRGDGYLYGFHRLDYAGAADPGAYFDDIASLLAYADMRVGSFERTATCRHLIERARPDQPPGWIADDDIALAAPWNSSIFFAAAAETDPLAPRRCY